MSVQSATAAGRRAALARMTSTADVRRKSGTTATDSDGYDVDQWEYVYSDIPFRLVGGDTRRVSIGGVDFQEATARADFPWDTFDLADGDLIEVTGGEWVGSVYRIVEAVKGDQRTARRVPVVETVRPEEWA